MLTIAHGRRKFRRKWQNRSPHYFQTLSCLQNMSKSPSHDTFVNDLKTLEFSCVNLSKFEKKQNRILIASKTPLNAGEVQAPTNIIDAVTCNMLHLKDEYSGINILGIRMPLPLNAPQKKAWWDWVTGIAQEYRDRPFIITGDFNTDPTKEPGIKRGCAF